jgi:hypothetical protein
VNPVSTNTVLSDGISAGESTRESSRAFIVAAVLILLLAASLRIYHITQRSLWLDEAIAANISRGTLSQTLILTRDLHSAPITDPLILHAVEKVSAGPLAVRIPSFVASVLAVFLMLCFVTIPSIDYKTAGLSALMLSVSAAQIRYAQEVREYSLSVLFATVLLYVFLSYVTNKGKPASPIPLYAALFGAPLIQYGLVLFSFGILSTLFVFALMDRDRPRRIVQIIVASGSLALGGLVSLFLTLRYQWGDDAWYLNDFFWTPGTNLLRFILTNTHHLITFLLPGLAAAAISSISILIYLVTSIRARRIPPVALLTFISCGIVLICSLRHLYPYGGTRQCLFLAPVLCLFASESLVQVTKKLPAKTTSMAFAAVVCVVIVSGVLQIRLLKPYAEVEDIQQVLHSLQEHIQPGDNVYIYPGAVFAVDFYVKERDPRFIYGDYHQQAPEKYVPEMVNGLNRRTNRLWIVFSHIYRGEDQRILRDLSKDWDVESMLSVTGSALYLATRRPISGDAAVVEASQTIPAVPDHTHDNFWDWNVRNSRHPAN